MQYFDFQSGQISLSNISPNLSAGLTAYGAQAARYPYLDSGFDLPYPVPSDLLIPFGDFVIKYNLQSMVGFIYTFAQGMGDLLAQPTIYVFKNFGSGILRSLQVGFLTTEFHNNNLLYDQATIELKQDVLYNSSILAVDRNDQQAAKVLVSTPSGLTLIKAQNLVLTIPLKLDNLIGWDLSLSQHSLFGQFTNAGYETGILRNSGYLDQLKMSALTPFTIIQCYLVSIN